MPLATVSAVQAEGSFVRQQFNKATDAELEALLAERLTEAAAEVQARVGASAYATEEPMLRQVLTTAEIYLATAKALQTIQNIVATWDAEALPAEFIDSGELSAIVARYRGSVDRLLAPYEQGVRAGARPYLGARGIAIER
jgi:hypothetical protein